MPKADYIKTKEADFANQLLTFKNNIPNYATLLGLTAPQLAAQAADADYFSHVLICHDVIDNCAQQWTTWKRLVRNGGDAPASGAPAAPELPSEPVPPVAPGIEKRFRDLAKRIKANANYNEGIGEALGIEGDVQSGPDLATLKPALKLELSGGQVLVKWGWQGQRAFLTMIEIQVKRGEADYALLAYDSTPNYLDSTPLPATAEKWTYRAIYRIGDQRVGQWSDETCITVAD